MTVVDVQLRTPNGVDPAADNDTAFGGRTISFGHYCVIPEQRLLLESGSALRIGSRALDLLITLVERPGEVVRKDELMARVWPNTFVGTGNLKVHVAALRKILRDGQDGNRYVVNIPGRGYSFVAPVTIAEIPRTPTSQFESDDRMTDYTQFAAREGP